MASKKQRAEDDRLNGLPESLLLHILSFLDTRQAVLTSILSSTWRDLWTFIPSLNFDQFSTLQGERRNYDESNFIRLVHKVLSIHAAPKIRSFGLHFRYQKKHSSDVDVWIHCAVRKGVEELDIGMIMMDYYEFPCWVFKCETLASLKLRRCILSDVEFSLFSSIIKLSLSDIKLRSVELRDLLAGCPLLEDLVIEHCSYAPVLCISSSSNPRLKRLEVEHHDIGRVEVDAPHLQILKLYGRYGHCSFKELPSLREARFRLLSWYKRDLSFLELSVRNLCHAKLLKLSRYCIQVHLRDAEESLTRKLNFHERRYWESLTVPFPCLVHRLKSIKITNFFRQEDDSYRGVRAESFGDISAEMILVRFLLRNAMVLEKITIHAYSRPPSVNNYEWKKIILKVSQELSAIPRASPLVDVVFLHD